jgi:hypothetical protein
MGRPENTAVAASYRCNGIVTGGHDAVTGSQEAPTDRMWEERVR